jgi:hypothetical protein
MDPVELLETTAAAFERLGIRYFVTGSMASMAYGEQRLTNDVDIVASIRPGHVPALVKAFPAPEYYADEEMIRDAVRDRSLFNILHPSSGLKVDVIVCPDSEFDLNRFSRARRIASSDAASAFFSSPEDVILSKMEFYKEGGSEKHLRDITGILKVKGPEIDRDYISRWADRLGVADVWLAVQDRMKGGGTK